jgi:hypothetical protein
MCSCACERKKNRRIPSVDSPKSRAREQSRDGPEMPPAWALPLLLLQEHSEIQIRKSESDVCN